MIDISCLIPTISSPDIVWRLIECLSHQQADQLVIEYIIIDNSKTGDIFKAIDNTRTNGLISVLREQIPGKSNALNRGLSAASGNLVVFTDDDIKPDKSWLKNLHRASHQWPEIDIFGGCVKISQSMIPRWILESRNLQELLITQHDLGPETFLYPPGRYPVGPNMAIRRKCIAAINTPWPTNLGPGTDLPVGDERGFIQNIFNKTVPECLYVGSAHVTHMVDPQNLRLYKLFKRSWIGGIAAGYLNTIPPIQNTPPTSADITTNRIKSILKTSSVSEWCCVILRAFGYFIGKAGIIKP